MFMRKFLFGVACFFAFMYGVLSIGGHTELKGFDAGSVERKIARGEIGYYQSKFLMFSVLVWLTCPWKDES
jgi:hypothetical protein